MECTFRKAVAADLDRIWEILQGAIARRKADGSNQWQDGYPNPAVVSKDIERGWGFVLVDMGDRVAAGADIGAGTTGDKIVGYCAILINDEPAYADLVGKWLTDGDFVVFHRVAIAEEYLGRGLAQKMLAHIDDFARSHNIKSVKADTNFDNIGMQKVFEKMGYIYCGEVTFRGFPRRAYEKVLTN